MPLRLIEIVLPEKHKKEIKELLEEHKVLGLWEESLSERRGHIKFLVSTGESGKVLDLLEKRFSHIQGFRIILLPVEASIPRPEPPEKEKTPNGEELKEKNRLLNSSESVVKNCTQISKKQYRFLGCLWSWSSSPLWWLL